MNVDADLRFKTSQDIIGFYDAPSEFRLAKEKTPLEIAVCSYEEEAYDAGIGFIARALNNRTAILWGWICFRYSFIKWTGKECNALESVRQWLVTNDQTIRKKMERIAQDIQYESSIAWLCQAVFWSGGSITEVGAPALEPPDHLLSHAIYGAMKLAILLKQGERMRPDLQRQYMFRGIELIALASRNHT